MIIVDVAALTLAVAVTFWEVAGSVTAASPSWIVFVLPGVIALPVFWMFGLYASIIRYVGIELFRTGLLATLVVAVVWAVVCFAGGLINEPYRIGLHLWALSLILIVGGRFFARFALLRTNVERESVIIYGAGDAGALLISNLLTGDDYLPVAVVDDDQSLDGKRIQGRASGHSRCVKARATCCSGEDCRGTSARPIYSRNARYRFGQGKSRRAALSRGEGFTGS
jgi:FlaA1/EpsC-like NDP-sugar epimerase